MKRRFSTAAIARAALRSAHVATFRQSGVLENEPPRRSSKWRRKVRRVVSGRV